MLVLSALVFLAVTLGLMGAYLWWAPTRAQQRLQALAPTPEKSAWAETAVKLVGPFAQLSSPTGDEDASPMRTKFLHAGIRHPDAMLIYFGIKTLLPFLFAFLTFLLLRLTNPAEGLTLVFWLMTSALVACYLPNAILHLLAKVAVASPTQARAWTNARGRFTDIAAGHLAYPAASTAVAAGLMTPAPDGSFQPSRVVTGAEAIEAVERLRAMSNVPSTVDAGRR